MAADSGPVLSTGRTLLSSLSIGVDDMLNDRLSHGLWEKTAPPAPLTLLLAGDPMADAVVIGAGYAGLSTAALRRPICRCR